MSSEPNYHIPVLFFEAMESLAIKPNGVYVDVTMGGAGHSRGILERLGPEGKLIAFDQDPDAWPNAPQDPRFTLVKQNFRHMLKYLKFYGIKEVDGVLADLGVSSHQFDMPERGFSFRFEAPLDMRMNQSSDKTARKVLASYDSEQLMEMFRKYGELKKVHVLVGNILEERKKGIKTTKDLVAVAEMAYGKRNCDPSLLAQIFQALRIEVNDELKALEEFLLALPEVLKQGGIAAIMSYHSLEDRLVKNYLKTGDLGGKQEKDFYGNLLRPLKPLQNKPIIPSLEEKQKNSRATSAKMRVAEKL